jgi:hypothetical protein
MKHWSAGLRCRRTMINLSLHLMKQRDESRRTRHSILNPGCREKCDQPRVNNPSPAHSVEHFIIVTSGLLVAQGPGRGSNSGVKEFAVSRVSYEHGVFHSLASSLFHRTTQFGDWPTTSFLKTLSTGITFCYFVSRQAEPNIPAWWRSPQLKVKVYQD